MKIHKTRNITVIVFAIALIISMFYIPFFDVKADEVLSVSLSGILILEQDNEHILAGAVTDNPEEKILEYRWSGYDSKSASWFEIQDWSDASEWVDFVPDSYGDYMLVVWVREKGQEEYIEVSTEITFHPYIIGNCQMPYEGEGGGYLIGFESKENPEQSFQYEMLILDCTLLAEGQDAWIYTTGRCNVAEGNALWTIWQPEYGYYWTLFRLYDADGTMIDEICYGFENVIKKKDWETTYGFSVIEPYLNGILAACTNDSMSREEKLRRAYLYVTSNYSYKSLSANHPAEFTAAEYYAYTTMTTGYGNCYGFSAVFYYLALMLGYDAHWYQGYVGTRRDIHGWVEIDGLIYDPELDKYNKINLYGVTNGHPYKYWYE